MKVQPLGQEDTLEKGMATHSSILAWRIPRQRGLAGYGPWGRQESDTTECLSAYPQVGGCHDHSYAINEETKAQRGYGSHSS